LFCCIDAGIDKAIYSAQQVALRLHSVTVNNLHFITSPQVDAAVAAFRIAKLNVQLEVLKFLFRYQVSTRFLINHHAISHMKLVIIRDDPLRELTVQQLNSIAPPRFSFPVQRRSPHAGPLLLIPFRASCPALQLFSFEMKLKIWVALALGPLRRDRKAIGLFLLGILDFGNGSRTSGCPYKTPHQGLVSRSLDF